MADMIDVQHATAENPSLQKARDGKNKPQSKIYDGWIFPTLFGSAKHENWKTGLDTMFVLKKADIESNPQVTVPSANTN